MPEERVLLITGATGGIGAATARAAVDAGWRVALGARDAGALDALVDELGGPDRAVASRCEVTDWEQQQRLVNAATEQFGRLDGAFANAGFGAKSGFTGESPEHWRDMILTNVYGVALTIRATIDQLRARDGHLVLAGSVAGRIGIAGSLYSATKAAVAAMGEAARLELVGTGVRVTVVEPGYTRSPFWDKELDLEALEVDDVARVVMWALSQPPHVNVNEILVRPVAQRP